ncbi:uncharacterized protein LOC107019373 [Solanum pennellii]|uniref:Uncharacterized protein LOC107019373 n=1 Tax=Solanum pennellii TaxID=28526 RepID=A0ABM1GSQ9_SOLPN|nr:uncharacterized protein LOC107019373 [Solanum pennellii]
MEEACYRKLILGGIQLGDEEIANARAPSRGDQVPPLEEVVVDDKAPTNTPPMTEAEMKAILTQMDQSITNQDQATTVQAQAMTAQANQEVAPRVHQQVSTMASRLRDFTRMNPPTFYGSKVDEDLQEFIDEVYKILYAMGVSTSEKAEMVKEAKAKRKDRDTKRARSFEGGAAKNRLEIQDNTRFKNRFSNQVPSEFPKSRDEKSPRPKVQKGKIESPSIDKPSCNECGKKNFCACLLLSDKCFGCGKVGHMVRDCPNAKKQE